jgi:ribulose-phosphate 3-epimerase
MKVVPAILAEKFDDCLKMLRQAESFTDYVQIDLMDGHFVPSKSFPGEEINKINASALFEIHLMVKDPSSLMAHIHHTRLKKVIFHFESKVDPFDFIGRMKKKGIPTGLAVNPETQLIQFREIANHVRTLLFLAVDPGHYGSPFRPEVLKKIEETRRLFPDKTISVDGGVSLDNLKLFKEIGVDSVCVGSRIFLKGNPEENYKQFLNKIRELEATETR